MTNEEKRKLILSTKGRFFGAKFIKRTNGELRVMNARLGVRKYLKGGQQAFNPREYDLVTVWDRNKMGYRMIPLDSLIELTINEKKYIFKEENKNG